MNVDLSQLAVERSQTAPSDRKGGKSAWLSRYALPLFILIAFGGLLGWAARDSVMPSTPVTVVPVLVARFLAALMLSLYRERLLEMPSRMAGRKVI